MCSSPVAWAGCCPMRSGLQVCYATIEESSGTFAQFEADCGEAALCVAGRAAQVIAMSSSSYLKLFTSALMKSRAISGARLASLLSAANAILFTSR